GDIVGPAQHHAAGWRPRRPPPGRVEQSVSEPEKNGEHRLPARRPARPVAGLPAGRNRYYRPRNRPDANGFCKMKWPAAAVCKRNPCPTWGWGLAWIRTPDATMSGR